MRLNHLHLHARDVERTAAFYRECFGLHEHARHGDILFLRDDGGLDLALGPDPDPEPLPDWYHHGFRLESRDDVRDLRLTLEAAGVEAVGALVDEPDLCAFRCRDPDGRLVEIYWE